MPPPPLQSPAPPPSSQPPPPTNPLTRLDLSKLSKTERRTYEERRKDYLLSHYGTEEQKRKLASLAAAHPPPYNIFHDIPETAPPQPSQPSWQLVADSDAGADSTTGPGEGGKDPDDSGGEDALTEQKADAPPVAVVAPGHQTHISAKELQDQPYSIVNDEAHFEMLGGLVQATARPLDPVAYNLPDGHGTFEIPGHTTWQATGHSVVAVILWWVGLILVVGFLAVRFGNSRCWRRKYYGS